LENEFRWANIPADKWEDGAMVKRIGGAQIFDAASARIAAIALLFADVTSLRASEFPNRF
jgi:hypothetical protein